MDLFKEATDPGPVMRSSRKYATVMSPKLWKNRLRKGHHLPTGRFNLWRDIHSCGDCITLINYLERTHELSSPSDSCVSLSLGVLILQTLSTPWGVPPPFLLTRPRKKKKRGSTSHRRKRTSFQPLSLHLLAGSASCFLCLLDSDGRKGAL